MEDGGVTFFSWEVYACILLQSAARESRTFQTMPIFLPK